MSDPDRNEDGLPVVAADRQRTLIVNARRVLAADPRVLGVWLSGSFGSQTHDQFSDVDLWVVVDDLEAFAADWPQVCDRIAPTVFRRQLGSAPIFNQITPDWLRFDVVVSTADVISKRTRSTVTPLYDPSGLSVDLADPAPPRQPDPDRVGSITIEFLRVLGLLPVVVGRDEYLVGQSGAGLLRSMLLELMLEDVAVEERGGALHLNRLLPPDRQRVVAELPPPQPTRSSVIEAHRACAAAFLPLARELHERCDLTWPAEFEAAARRQLATLSVTIGEP